MSNSTRTAPPPSGQPIQAAGSDHNEDKTLADKDTGESEGEDEGSSANEGRDDHLKDDQKPTTK